MPKSPFEDYKEEEKEKLRKKGIEEEEVGEGVNTKARGKRKIETPSPVAKTEFERIANQAHIKTKKVKDGLLRI